MILLSLVTLASILGAALGSQTTTLLALLVLLVGGASPESGATWAAVVVISAVSKFLSFIRSMV